ncbi:glycosyltransferase family 2 protein [Thermus thermamylovorans]|uniref:Glycosyltransferase n=1 Tax=Thermus thermamylovorans TaxID=2509362 RepID=A0A4V2IUJ1_9DEIN|nr:glycosyltransferase [Thermus thermamylovorans]TBH17280.1 glycosyltransferase [Thermus thermamylovorans]
MISVLIPTKGRPGMLREALRSLQGQTFSHWEAVVAEDGEGEGLEVVRALKDPRVRGLRNAGRGQVEARRTALEAAQGEAVLFLDDDDLLLDPAYLHRAWRALAQGAGVAYGEGVLLLADREIPFAPGEVGPWLLRDNRLLASGTALGKKALRELGGLDPAMGDYWDWDLWLRAYRAGLPFRYLKGRGVGVRVHGGNGSYGARREERARFLERLRAKHGLEPIPLKDHLQLALESSPGY